MTLMKNARGGLSGAARISGAPGIGGPFLESMTERQEQELKALSIAARDPQAYDPTLGPDEAATRIAALKAKLVLLGTEEHTD